MPLPFLIHSSARRCGIMYAAEMGHLEVVEALVRLRAEVNLAVMDGRTPVYMAAHMGHTAVVEALGQGGADVNLASKNGWTPLDIARKSGKTDTALALERLGAVSGTEAHATDLL
jgi:ankyrin repeat protein